MYSTEGTTQVLEMSRTVSCHTPGIYTNVKSITFNFCRELIMLEYNICPSTDITSKCSTVTDKNGDVKFAFLRSDNDSDEDDNDSDEDNEDDETERMNVYTIVNGEDRTITVIDNSKKGIIPSTINSLDKILFNMKFYPKLFPQGHKENIEKMKSSFYSSLPDNLKLLVDVLYHAFLNSIKSSIQKERGNVIFCDDNQIMWTEEGNKISSILRDFENGTYSEFDSVFVINQHKRAEIKNLNFTLKGFPEYCKFTNCFIQEFMLRHKEEGGNVLQNIKLFYSLFMELVNNPKLFINNIIVSKSNIKKPFMLSFIEDQKSKDKTVKLGDTVEYQFVVLPEQINENGQQVKIRSHKKIRQLSEDDLIDYGFYIEKLFLVYAAIDRKSIFSKKLNNPMRVLTDLFYKHGKLPTSDEFYSELHDRAAK